MLFGMRVRAYLTIIALVVQGLAGFMLKNQAFSRAQQYGIGGGYGCWCYFGEEHAKHLGRGTPLDEFDMACQQLYFGYECTNIDAAARNRECIPWDTEYNGVLIQSGMDAEAACRTVNLRTRCEYDICVVESTFGLTLQRLGFDARLSPKGNYLHSNPNFDREEMCGSVTNSDQTSRIVFDQSQADALGVTRVEDNLPIGVRSENTFIGRGCCGRHPNRKPFVGAANRQCCINTIYNPLLKICCQSGPEFFCA